MFDVNTPTTNPSWVEIEKKNQFICKSIKTLSKLKIFTNNYKMFSQLNDHTFLHHDQQQKLQERKTIFLTRCHPIFRGHSLQRVKIKLQRQQNHVIPIYVWTTSILIYKEMISLSLWVFCLYAYDVHFLSSFLFYMLKYIFPVAKFTLDGWWLNLFAIAVYMHLIGILYILYTSLKE